MSRGDRPDREQGFFGRWIKRKAEARDRPAPDEATGEPAPRDDADAGAAPDGQPEARAQEPAFDLSRLPGLDEIRADTNLADFMRKEVPAALRNAALKKAWALDPAIRDYVNPAREYAYDWNTPGGVPGSGPLEAGFDALKEVANALGPSKVDYTLELGEATTEPFPPTGGEAQAAAAPGSPVRRGDEEQAKDAAQVSDEKPVSQQTQDAAPQQATGQPDQPAPRRRHGGAAPV